MAQQDGHTFHIVPPAQPGPVFIYRCQGAADGTLHLQAHNRGHLPTRIRDDRSDRAWQANPQGQWQPADPAGPQDGYRKRTIGHYVDRSGDGDTNLPGDGDTNLPGDGHTNRPGDGHTNLPGDGDTNRPGDGDTPRDKPCNSPLGCDGGDGGE